MTFHTIGSNYEATKELDIAGIAKIVRNDLRANWAGSKIMFSVRIQRYAGGQSLNVYATNTGIERRTEEADKFITAVRRIINQYNYDDSDSISDYSNVRFHVHVGIES